MLKFKTLFVAVLLLSTTCIAQPKTTAAYINKFSPLSKELCAKYGIPASIILGVSILESGSGTSLNSRQLNNYFGIVGKNNLKKRRTRYKQYATPDASFRDFCQMISRKNFYAKLKNNMNYRQWLSAMNRANYAGAKEVWVNRVTNIIVKNKLNKYDK